MKDIPVSTSGMPGSPAHAPTPATNFPAPAPIAGGPIHIPTRPNPSYIVSGVLLIALAAWLGLSFLPAHAPMDAFDKASHGIAGVLNKDPDAISRARTWHLAKGPYVGAWMITIAIFIAGVQSIVRGALWRDHVEAWCPSCKQTVAAQKREWGAWCPHHNGWASLDHVKIGVAVGVLVLLFVAIIYAIVASS